MALNSVRVDERYQTNLPHTRHPGRKDLVESLGRNAWVFVAIPPRGVE
jgi:hypothetical protein